MRANRLSLTETIRDRAQPFQSASDLEPLIARVKNSKVVMLGEATHGTHEFYDWRRIISQELIEHHGFQFIAVEGDWPPCQILNSYVSHGSPFGTARDALTAFHRWPTWMWANAEIAELAEWLHQHNASSITSEGATDKPIGFHGLDVYSLFESMEAVLEQLHKINPFLARRAKTLYSCFDRFNQDERRYARSLVQMPEGCEAEVAQVLSELLTFRIDGLKDREAALFDARQNARIVRNAEDYYRTMILGTEDSWNVRDRHMMETLELLLDYYGPNAKGIVWEHNTHIGDYRATDMLEMGQVNIGGLARERLGDDQVSLVGFGTYEGSVIASHAWDGPIQTLPVPPGRNGSYEAAFHDSCVATGASRQFVLMTEEDRDERSALAQKLGHRAIGVVYDPAHERWGNYVPTSLANRYDAFVFIDRTRAVDPFPLEFIHEDVPETWPRGQ
jgi:erythromycin esterase-like protein